MLDDDDPTILVSCSVCAETLLVNDDNVPVTDDFFSELLFNLQDMPWPDHAHVLHYAQV